MNTADKVENYQLYRKYSNSSGFKDGQYEEGFWHIITIGKDQRLLDYKRAKRIIWIKPIIENFEHSSVLKWSEERLDKKGKKIKKTYIWFRDGKFLIVLKELPRKYFLTTAFYVTGSRNDRYYYEKYKKAEKKGPEC